jgi:hypothetical protein
VSNKSIKVTIVLALIVALFSPIWSFASGVSAPTCERYDMDTGFCYSWSSPPDTQNNQKSSNDGASGSDSLTDNEKYNSGADECIWPQCYYPYDNNQQYGTDDNCKAPDCLIPLNQDESNSNNNPNPTDNTSPKSGPEPNPSTDQESTKKFNVQIVLDHARKEQYQVRVIVYGVHTLNKPTLDKPGVTIYASQCVGVCSINAGIWSFTDWKVNNGDQIKACALNTETGNEYCGYGSADKSRTDTIHISIYSSSQSLGSPSPNQSPGRQNLFNNLDMCRAIEKYLVSPCTTYVNSHGILSVEGKRAKDCISGGMILGGIGLYLNLPPLETIKWLKYFSMPKCDGIVKWSVIENDVRSATAFLELLQLIT